MRAPKVRLPRDPKGEEISIKHRTPFRYAIFKILHFQNTSFKKKGHFQMTHFHNRPISNTPPPPHTISVTGPLGRSRCPTNHMIRSPNLRFGKVIKNQYPSMIRFDQFFEIRFDSWVYIICSLRFDSLFNSAHFET